MISARPHQTLDPNTQTPSALMPVDQAMPRYALPRPDRLARRLLAQRTTLEPVLIDEILAAYGWQAQGAAAAPAGAGRSDSVIVATADGKKLLKRYKATVEPTAIVHEHSILQHLAEIAFPAPRVSAASSGATLIQRDAACYAVFDALEGYRQYHHYCLWPPQKMRCISVAGAALGALHTTLAEFTPAGQHPHGFRSSSGNRVREIEWFIDALDWCRSALPDLKSERDPLAARLLTVQADRIEARLWSLDEYLKAAGPLRLVIHGDYGPYNLFFKPNTPIVILDFELARLDWRLTDLATALPSFARTRLGFNVGSIRAFLAGYQTRCPIDRAELALLPMVWHFLMLRQVVVLWQRYWRTGTRAWLEESQRKLRRADWIADRQPTFTRWLTA